MADQPADSYSPVEAARVLGLSEKRVRQLADQGRIAKAQDVPLRLAQQSVHDLRAARAANPPAGGGAKPARVDVDVRARLEALVTGVTENSRRALETAEASARSTEAALRDMLAQAQARVTEVEARNAALQAELDEARRPRGIFSRRTP